MKMPEEPGPTDPADSPQARPIGWIVPLEPPLRADLALKKIHLELLRRISANEQGVSAALGGEYLHDFRVALRRTRTGLRQLKRVYPRDVAKRFTAEFSWLSSTTNAARDVEVFLASLELYRADLGNDTIDALAPHTGLLRDHQRIERTRCTDALASGRYRSMMASWRRFLEQTPKLPDLPGLPGLPDPPDLKNAPENASRPISEVAAERIHKAYCRVAARGAEMQLASAADAFHRLRLDCKKLRYLLEFFGQLFDGEQSMQTIVTLRQTQDSLGAINDLRVQADWLARLPDPPTAATRRLAAYLGERQQAERSAFLDRFAAFIENHNETTLRRFLATTEARISQRVAPP